MNAKLLLLLALYGIATTTAQAQWQWVDSSGRKVFSDRPPPPSVPAQSVLTKPTGAGVIHTAATPSSSPADGTPPSSAPAAAPPNTTARGVDPELEQKKAEQEAREAQQKQAEEHKLAQQRKENCDRAKRARDVMQSGQMLSHTNAQGDRGFMDDATRRQEIARANQVMASNCP